MVVVTIVLSLFPLMQMINKSLPPTREMLPESFFWEELMVFQNKVWNGVLKKVCAWLSKWKWLLSQLSYRGRVLVVNSLVALTHWQRLVVLSAPQGLMQDVQKAIVNFFWSGYHWFRSAVIYVPVAKGGLGTKQHSAQNSLFLILPNWPFS